MSVTSPTRARVHHKLIVAGFGGQGVLKLGQTLAEAAMRDGLEVIWTPAYGPEMRGGPAFCTVILSSEPIGSPVVAEADTAIFMDRLSVGKYQRMVRPDGRIIINASLVRPEDVRQDVPVLCVPANEIANSLGMPQAMNMVLLGALLELTGLASLDTVIDALKYALPERHHHLIPLNRKALEAGAAAVKK